MVIGDLPLCYGPGPNMNLTPRVTIKVYRGAELVLARTFPDSEQHPTFELSLAPGDYGLLAQGQKVHAHAMAGTTTRADFRQPNCV